MTDEQLAAIEERARKRSRVCEWCPKGAPFSEACGAVATKRCAAGGDCGIDRCEAHAEDFSDGCDHEWHDIDDGNADVTALLAEVHRLGRQRVADALRHTQESLRWADRRIELYERIIALEAQAKGERPSADVLAGELARAVAQGGAATFDATAEGVAYVVKVTRRDGT